MSGVTVKIHCDWLTFYKLICLPSGFALEISKGTKMFHFLGLRRKPLINIWIIKNSENNTTKSICDKH